MYHILSPEGVCHCFQFETLNKRLFHYNIPHPLHPNKTQIHLFWSSKAWLLHILYQGVISVTIFSVRSLLFIINCNCPQTKFAQTLKLQGVRACFQLHKHPDLCLWSELSGLELEKTMISFYWFNPYVGNKAITAHNVEYGPICFWNRNTIIILNNSSVVAPFWKLMVSSVS